MYRNRIFFLLLVFALMPAIVYARSSAARIIHVPSIQGDATPVLQAAIQEARSYRGRSIIIKLENADYHLYRTSSTPCLYHVSNTTSEQENPDATKHIGLWMKGLRNLTIDGCGARLVTHGEMTAFVMDSCSNICLRNFVLASADPTVPEMTVTETGEHHMVARIHPLSRYRIQDGRLSFVGDSWEWGSGLAQKYDPQKDVTWRSWMPLTDDCRAEELELGLVRFTYKKAPDAQPGIVFQMRDTYRDEVCGLIQYSQDIRLKHLRIAFTGNFGIVAQMSANITYSNLTFEPEPGSGRTCAGFADFLQMSGCRGLILVENSRFVGAQDDPINVHGTHLPVQEFLSPTELRVRYSHHQTFGFQSFLPGNEVDFIDVHTLHPVGTFRVKAARMENPREIWIKLTKPVPEDIRQRGELALENVTYTPQVIIRHNFFSRVPTRGILVTTRRPVLIEDNFFFRMQNSGVLISDDARSWYESGMARDVTIRRNHFFECGSPVINIDPANDRNEGPVHSSISIQDNRFTLKKSLAIRARSVDGLLIQGNSFYMSDGSPANNPVDTEGCFNVKYE